MPTRPRRCSATRSPGSPRREVDELTGRSRTTERPGFPATTPRYPDRVDSRLSDTQPSNDDDHVAEPTYGRFVSLGVIARGGMGIVLRARDPELDREVALKLLGPANWGRTGDTIGAQQLQR